MTEAREGREDGTRGADGWAALAPRERLTPDAERALVLAMLLRGSRRVSDLLDRLERPGGCPALARELQALPRERRARRLARLAVELFRPPPPCAGESAATPPPWRLWLRRAAQAHRGAGA